MHDLFVSYAHADSKIVRQVVKALEQDGVSVWYDALLSGGESWDKALHDALVAAQAVAVFILDRSLESDYIAHEISLALQSGIFTISILLPGTTVSDLPLSLRHIQALAVGEFPPRRRIIATAKAIAEAIRRMRSEIRTGPVTPEHLDRLTQLAMSQATESKGAVSQDKPLTETKSVFIVHGHDSDMLDEICRFLKSIEVRPVAMEDEESEVRSLLDKFFELGGRAKYAVVLESGYDYGAACRQFDATGVGERSLQFRARQNVILELGFFYG